MNTTEELTLRINGDSAGGQAAVAQFTGSLTSLFGTITGGVAAGGLLKDALEGVLSVVKNSIEAIPHMVTHATQLGNQLYEMSLRTGASVENLSALRFVASQTSFDFERLDTTFFMLEKNLGATGAAGDKVRGVIQSLGLSFATIRQEAPDQQFIDLVEALGKVSDRATQSHDAMLLFGRGARDMMGLFHEDVGQIIQEASDLGLIMDTKTAAGAHVAEIAFKAFDMQVEAIENKIGAAFIPAVATVARLLSENLNEAFKKSGLTIDDMQGALVSMAKTLLSWADTGVTAAEDLYTAFEQLKVLVYSVEYGLAALWETNLKVNIAMNENAMRTSPGLASAFKDLDQQQKDSLASATAMKEAFGQMIDQSAGAAVNADTVFTALHSGLQKTADGFAAAYAKTQEEITHFAEASATATKGASDDVTALSDKEQKALDKVLEHIKLLEAEATPEGALKWLKGSTAYAYDLAKGLHESVAELDKINKVDPTNWAAFTKIGEVMKPNIKDFQNNLETTVAATMRGLPDIMISAFEGGGNLVGAGKSLGVSLTKGLFTDTADGKGPFTHVVQSLDDDITKGMEHVLGPSGVGKTISGVLGNTISGILPAVGGLLGPALGALFNIGKPSKEELAARDTQGKLITSFRDAGGSGSDFTVLASGVTDAMAKIGKSSEDARQLVARLLDTHNPAVFKAALLDVNGVLAQVAKLTGNEAAATQGVNDAMSKWKLTINEMGPAFKQQNLDQMAGSLLKDWQLLVTAGGNNVDVLDHMKSGFQDLVTASFKTGSKIPENLKPAIQTLIDMGKLTDDSGNKLMSVDQLPFGKSLDTKFDTLIGKIGDLVDALTLDLTGAIKNLPDHTIKIGVQMPDLSGLDNQAPTEAFIPMARGGTFRVTKPTLFLAGEAGPEVAAFSGAGKNFGAGGPSVEPRQPVVVEMHLDGRVLSSVTIDNILKDTGGIRRVIKRVAN